MVVLYCVGVYSQIVVLYRVAVCIVIIVVLYCVAVWYSQSSGISDPKNLRVVGTSSTSLKVQWEKALVEIDRYILSVFKSQQTEMSPVEDSETDHLEPGCLCNFFLFAENDGAWNLLPPNQATLGSRSVGSPHGSVDNVVLQHDTLVSIFLTLCSHDKKWIFCQYDIRNRQCLLDNSCTVSSVTVYGNSQLSKCNVLVYLTQVSVFSKSRVGVRNSCTCAVSSVLGVRNSVQV
ncbi:hypothetical protein NFI96_030392 [Prochilodus magdalenae]|nr:hypothetical protein NFI96_030392 [Prochilodus magdalenae]